MNESKYEIVLCLYTMQRSVVHFPINFGQLQVELNNLLKHGIIRSIFLLKSYQNMSLQTMLGKSHLISFIDLIRKS